MRKEDEVEIPSLTLDDDELNERASGTAETSMPKAKRRLNPPPAQRAPTPISARRQSLAGIYALLLIIVAAAAGGAYWLWSNNQQLKKQLASAQEQIDTLNDQVLATDASTDALGSSVEQTLKNHDSEIRKLWGVAYDRNRSAIAEQSETVSALEDRVAQIRESLSTQSKLVAVQGDAFNEIEDGYNRLVDSVASVESAQEGQAQSIGRLDDAVTQIETAQDDASSYQREQLEGVRQRLDELTDRLSEMDAKVRSLGIEVETFDATPNNLPADLARRLQANEEAIDSIDQFRPQVLREINSLKSQVRQLSLEASLGGG